MGMWGLGVLDDGGMSEAFMACTFVREEGVISLSSGVSAKYSALIVP